MPLTDLINKPTSSNVSNPSSCPWSPRQLYKLTRLGVHPAVRRAEGGLDRILDVIEQKVIQQSQRSLPRSKRLEAFPFG